MKVDKENGHKIEIQTDADADGQGSAGNGRSKFQVSDRRFWVKDEGSIERAQPPTTRLPSYVEELKARTELAESRLKEKLEQLEAENEAFRSRLRKEFENRAQRGALEILSEFLEIVDNLERALQSSQEHEGSDSLREGVELNLRLFLDKLAAAGIEPLELEGLPFDPHTSEAVGMIPVQDPELDQKVVEVVQKGYLRGDQLLRPARVRVGRLE